MKASLPFMYKELLCDKLMRKEFKNDMASLKNAYEDLHGEVIVDGDNSEWISPMGVYRFKFSKEECIFWNPNTFHHIITLNIEDSIGHIIDTIKMTELDVANLIYSLSNFADEIYIFGVNDYYTSPIGRDEELNSFIFGCEVNPNYTEEDEVEFKETLLYNSNFGQLRDIFFIINKYNKFQQSMARMIKISVAPADLYTLIDALLYIIADIDLPEDYVSQIEDLYY